MGIYIEPSNINKKDANEKTTLLNRPDIARKKEYLKNHSIIDTLKIL